MHDKQHFGVIGAGVVGAGIAWHLAKRGHRVTLLEQGSVPNPVAASFDEHRLTRRMYPGQPHYARLMDECYAAWADLFAAMGEDHLERCGALSCSAEAGDWADQGRKVLDEVGARYELLSGKDVEQRYPFLTPGRIRWAALEPDGGVLFADRITTGLARLCAQAGVEIKAKTRVTSVKKETGIAVTDAGGELAFDELVVAAGAWIPRVLPDLGRELGPCRNVVAYFDPPAEFLEAWKAAPGIIDFGGPEEVWGIPPVRGTGLKLADIGLRSSAEAGSQAEVTAGELTTIRRNLANVLKDFDRYRLTSSKVCWNHDSPDSRFMLKRDGRVVMVSACAAHGFKFGAWSALWAAKALAQEIPFDRAARHMAGLDRPVAAK
ncbi:MAG TPA: FAD-dependent oxidoreductase [Dongiaceae bacterium]|nr:FAD-dependent oxidoreductase [Dongiaceae bacterium]